MTGQLLVLLVVALSMAGKDFFATLLVIAEANNRPLLAYLFDVCGDQVNNVYGALVFVNLWAHGVSWYSIEISSAAAVGSSATYFATRSGHRWFPRRPPE